MANLGSTCSTRRCKKHSTNSSDWSISPHQYSPIHCLKFYISLYHYMRTIQMKPLYLDIHLPCPYMMLKISNRNSNLAAWSSNLANTWLHPNKKISAPFHTSNHRLAIDFGWWLTLAIPRHHRLCHFCSFNVVEHEAHVVLECPSTTPLERDFFPYFRM